MYCKPTRYSRLSRAETEMMCFSLYTEGIFEYNFVDRKFNPKMESTP